MTDYTAEFLAAFQVGRNLTDAARQALNLLSEIRACGFDKTDAEMKAEIVAAIDALRTAVSFSETPIEHHVAAKVGTSEWVRANS